MTVVVGEGTLTGVGVRVGGASGVDEGDTIVVGGGVDEGIGVAEDLGVDEGIGVAMGVAEGGAVGVAEGGAVATAQEAAGADDRPIDSAKMCSSICTRVAPRSPRAGRGTTGKRSAETRLFRSSPIAV